MMFVPLHLALALLVGVQSRAPERGIFILEMSMPAQIEEWVGREFDRVRTRCGEYGSECWKRELRQEERPLNPVRASPDPTAPLAGTLLAVLGHTDGWPHVRFSFRSLSGSRTVWLSAEEIDDWGYGIKVVVRAKDAPSQTSVWIQLGGVPGPAWIEVESADRMESQELTGGLRSILGNVLRVTDEVNATNVRTGRRMTLSSQFHYVIERATKDYVLMRREVDSDSPCADDSATKGPGPSAPRYRIPLDGLFRKDGKPVVRMAYPRGC